MDTSKHRPSCPCDFESWSIPQIVTITREDSVSLVMDAAVCGDLGVICERATYTSAFDESTFRGGFQKSNVSDGIYRAVSKETKIEFAYGAG